MDASLTQLTLNDLEYFEAPGLNVMLAHDFYPEGHQGGVSIVQNGRRVATNGDLRLEPAPGQWSPVPAVCDRIVDREMQEIRIRMRYPDDARNRRGFNPIDYPDLEFEYTLRVSPEDDGFLIAIDLDKPMRPDWVGRVGLNLELFPGLLFGRTFSLDDRAGLFPRQSNGPVAWGPDGVTVPVPLATGRRLVVVPERDDQRMAIESRAGGPIQLVDGRAKHNNGWFVVRADVDAGATRDAVVWKVTPHAVPGWRAEPVVQVSQVGYHPQQPKWAVVELDPRDSEEHPIEVLRIRPEGGTDTVLSERSEAWGRFLRSDYRRLDFTSVRAPGMYFVRYGAASSSPFRIGPDVFERHVWQPTVDTFLPVQMCHMRVSDNYRVWHGACHLDDARMAPTDLKHVDGYVQGSATLSSFSSGEPVPGVNVGGWHDAGDYDLRVESQSSTIHGLALAYEEFGLDYDNTTIDQASRTVELQRPDGKPDVLQQVEHGALAIVAPYRAMGRLCRGIIERDLRQYTHLGDAATMTDNLPSDDDRWIFTEDNPRRELEVAAGLAAASRALRGFNDHLAIECLEVAQALFDSTQEQDPLDRVAACVELHLATGDPACAGFLREHVEAIVVGIGRVAWLAARSLAWIEDPAYQASVREALVAHRTRLEEIEGQTPYGVPYTPSIWGAGWGIQRIGFQHYWLHRHCPDLFPPEGLYHALSFVLGCHPGTNTASFVSGVGARSMIPGYGVNRADESYIPGGVGSGTALIRPDLPEFLEWPYLWQQTEYCLGAPTADYVFLVAAAQHLLSGSKRE